MDKGILNGISQLDMLVSNAYDPEGIVSLRCAANVTPQSINWLWDGWLAAGKLTILAGAAGTGKTTLALGLAAILTTEGGRWPDGQVSAKQGNVLIWSSEDNAEDTLLPRLLAAGADTTRCYFIEGTVRDGKRSPFDPASDIHELRKAVETIGGVSLLIIDPIVSAVAGDMHKANDVRRSLQAIVDFAAAYQCAVVGITHFSKGSSGRSPQDRVLGSQAFGALARMVLVAAKEEGGDRRVLARAKSNIAEDSDGVSYVVEVAPAAGEIEASVVVWKGVVKGTARQILGEVETDEQGGSMRTQDLEQLLIDLLKEHGGKMPAKLIKAEVTDAGYSMTSACNVKAKLGIESKKEPGIKTGGWYWYLPKDQAGCV